jgi:tetratricopeptide (TPR) repeat protein
MTKNWKYVLLMATVFPSAAAFAQSGDAGRKAVELENYQEAKSIYKKQLNDKKNGENAHFALGDIYIRTGKLDSAAYYFNRAIAADKKSAINYVGLGKLAFQNGNRSEAEKQFSDALKYSKEKDPYVLAMIAESYISQKEANEADIKKAISYLEKAAERDNNSTLVQIMLGDAYLKVKDGGKAMTAYERAIQIDPKNALPLAKKGALYTSSRNYNEAEDAFKQAIAIDPKFAIAYHDLGELYYFAGQYDKALSTFQKYIDLAEATPETRAKYASFLFLTKNYDKALVEVQQVLKNDPSNTVMNRLQAYTLLELKQPEKALTAINNYMQKVDKSKLIAEDFEYYGRILNANKKFSEAADNLKKAIEMEPTKIELYQELAVAYAQQGEYEKAVEVYNKKRENAEPSNADFFYMGNNYMMAGESARTAGNEQKAKDYFKKADETYANVTKSNPTYAPAHLWRAQANANIDPESLEGRAKPFYEEYIKLAMQEPEKNKAGLVQANYYLGAYYYLTAQDRENAVKHFQEVLKLDPKNEQATIALDQINKTPRAKK